MTYITNLYHDPSCRRQISTWVSAGDINVEALADGHFRYTHTGAGNWALLGLNWNALIKPGRVVVVAYTATSVESVTVEGATPLASGTTPSGATWKAEKINGVGNHNVFCKGEGSVTLEALAVYEGGDWPTVQQLLPWFPWFHGGTMPLP